jgi:hypothetical protein
MSTKDILRESVGLGHMLAKTYVGDLSDAELLVRSVPGSNHIAWQMGHMIGSTQQMLMALAQPAPELPAGFMEAYTAETSTSDDPKRFLTKAEYLALAEKMEEASLKAIDATQESALDKPAPEMMREYAPTVASALMMLGTHWTMHVGQFVPIRRKLGKKPVF